MCCSCWATKATISLLPLQASVRYPLCFSCISWFLSWAILLEKPPEGGTTNVEDTRCRRSQIGVGRSGTRELGCLRAAVDQKAVTSFRTPYAASPRCAGKARRRQWIIRRVNGFFFAEGDSHSDIDSPFGSPPAGGEPNGEMRGGCDAAMGPGDHTVLIAFGENAPEAVGCEERLGPARWAWGDFYCANPGLRVARTGSTPGWFRYVSLRTDGMETRNAVWAKPTCSAFRVFRVFRGSCLGRHYWKSRLKAELRTSRTQGVGDRRSELEDRERANWGVCGRL